MSSIKEILSLAVVAIGVWLGVPFIHSGAIARSHKLESMAWTFLMFPDVEADPMKEQ